MDLEEIELTAEEEESVQEVEKIEEELEQVSEEELEEITIETYNKHKINLFSGIPFRKIEDVLLFHKHKDKDGEVILLDEDNTYWNIKLYIKKKYPNIPIKIINEGRGD